MNEFFRKPIVKTLMLKGQEGQSIKGIKKTGTNGFVDTYTITLTDGTTSTFTVTNGKEISNISKAETSGLVDTYTINFNDGTRSTFTVTNGKEISSILKTGTSGLVDIYTINFNDGTKSTFTVTNGDSDYKPAVAALGKRIDNLILSSGNESSSEVIDARTGYDGTVYPTLGTAIRSQANKLNNDIGDLDDVVFNVIQELKDYTSNATILHNKFVSLFTSAGNKVLIAIRDDDEKIRDCYAISVNENDRFQVKGFIPYNGELHLPLIVMSSASLEKNNIDVESLVAAENGNYSYWGSGTETGIYEFVIPKGVKTLLVNKLDGKSEFFLKKYVDVKKSKIPTKISELEDGNDLVTLQKPYLVEYETLLDNYIKEDTSIVGYIGWDVLSIQVVPNDKVIVFSPSDSKYNAIYSSDNVKCESIVLKKGMNLIEIPEEYRFLRVSNEREIAKKVKFYVLKTQEINGNTKKIKLADNGTFIFDTIPLTYIYDIDGSERYSPTFYSSDYIDVSNHEKIVIESTESSKYNAWYDANREFIQNLEYKVGFTEFEVPTNAKFIRVSCSQEEFKNIKVIFDTSIYYSKFTYYGAFLPRSARWWKSDRESIIDGAYNKLLSAYKLNPDIIPLFICTDSHRWSPQHPQRYVNNIDVDGMEIANINLGDDVAQYWADGKFDMIYNNIRYVKNYIGVCGNHDKIDGTDTTEYFLRRIFTSKKARYIAKSKRCCYTVNDNLHNVKYIVFDPYYAPNSGVPMVSIPTVVATWLVKELSKNDGYDIIFLNHQPLTDNNIHRDGTKQTWKMESYELPIFTALFNLLKARKNKLKGTYTDTDGINHNYDFSQCENELLCLLHGHSHEELYYIEDGLLSYCCDWDGAESNGYKSTFIAIDRNAETFTAWIAKGSEKVELALELKIN